MSLLMKNLLNLPKEAFRSLKLVCPKYKVNYAYCECNRTFSKSPILQIPRPSLANLPPRSDVGTPLLIVGFGLAGALSYIGYNYAFGRKTDDYALPNSSSTEDYFLAHSPPKYPAIRTIKTDVDQSGFKITLYQYQTCPFCCKVRAFLDYYGFSYDVIEVNSVTHKQTKWTTYRKVPFLIIEQEEVAAVMQLMDSTMIISALQSFLSNKSQTLESLIKGFPIVTYEESGKKKTEISNRYSIMYGEHPADLSKDDIKFERKWRKWVDDVYIHTLSPNVYRTLDESFQAFSWFSEVGRWKEVFQMWERLLVVYVGSFAMYLIGKRLKKKYNLNDDVRLTLYEETNTWLKAVKKSGGKFLGGNEPNLSDLSMYGVLTAIEGCDAFQDLLNNTNIESWFYGMKNAVETHQGERYLIERGPNRK